MLLPNSCGIPIATVPDTCCLPSRISASVCCGAHAGDPETILQTLRWARERGVVVGAHPGAHGVEVEVRGRGGRQIVGQDDHLERRESALAHGERAVEERRLGHQDAAAGVADDVLGLLDGERGVHRERSTAVPDGRHQGEQC